MDIAAALSPRESTIEPIEETVLEPVLDLPEDKFPGARYLAHAVIGGGAAGTVYRCTDKLLNKRVALKTLKHLSDEQVMAFQREAKATSMLHHENIVQILDFGIVSGGTPYMVMEYIDGLSLDQIIGKEGRLDPLFVIDIFVQVCNALGHAHGKGVFHRDIKPTNIILDRSEQTLGRVKVIDFGVAGFKEPDQSFTISQGRKIIGSPLYMSPEQAKSKSFDERSEVYSVGCALFEALAGKPPFEAETVLQLLDKHVMEQPPLVGLDSHDYGSMAAELESIVAKCLAKHPAERYKSMAELEESLLAALNSPTHATRAGSISSVGSQTGNETASSAEWNDRADAASSLVPGDAAELEAAMTADPQSARRRNLTIMILSAVSAAAAVWFLINSFRSVLVTDQLPVVRLSTDAEQGVPKLAPITDDEQKHHFEIANFGRPWIKIHGRIKDDDLAELKNRHDFKVLALDHQQVTGAGLRYLKDLNIELIEMQDTLVNGAGLKEVAKVKSLTELVLDNTMVVDADLKPLTKLPKLRLISLMHTRITNQGLKILSEIPTLWHLKVDQCERVSAGGVAQLARVPHLTNLDISYTSVRPVDLVVLRGLPFLDTLAVEGLGIGDSDLDKITCLNLKALDISKNHITGKGLVSIAKMKGLHELRIAGMNLSDSDIEKLAAGANLRIIDVSNNPITDKAIFSLGGMSKLRNLKIEGCTGLTPVGLHNFVMSKSNIIKIE